MQGLKYLTVSELESLLVNLDMEKDGFVYLMHPSYEEKVKVNRELYSQVESEILERTLLGNTNEGGCSN